MSHSVDLAKTTDDRFARIVALAADAIICVDDSLNITLFNDGAERTFGYSRGEVLGQPLDILIPERFRKGHDHHVADFAKGPPTARHMGERQAIFAVHKNGKEFPAEATISKIDLGADHVLTVVLRDITAQKRVEQELERRVAERTAALEAEVRHREQAQGQLLQVQRMEAYGQLTGGVAHDFNNLLTVVGGNLELLQDRLTDERHRKLVGRALNAVEMGARLTRRLLAFARQSRLEPKVLDLNEHVLGVIDLLRRTIGETIAISSVLMPALWAVRADPSEIENALLNLAINSRDAMPDGGKLVIETSNTFIDEGFKKMTHIETITPGDYVVLSVTDTGIGMPPDVLARVFEPFFTTKEPGRGTGLGLASIYGFARQSGGLVTIYSEVDKGTTVNLYLPRVQEALARSAGPETVDSTRRDSARTVLVVEDNAAVREITVERLEGLGYQVVACESGPAAIAMLSTAQKFDLVFSDVVMSGGMSGFDLASWLKVRKPEVKVLLTSGFTEEIARNSASVPGDPRLLRKPYSTTELARAIAQAINGRQDA